MNPAIKDTLESVISRFPEGSHADKIRHMLDGEAPLDFEEVRKGLEDIRESGGSERVYTSESDKEDSRFYMDELKEAASFSYKM